MADETKVIEFPEMDEDYVKAKADIFWKECPIYFKTEENNLEKIREIYKWAYTLTHYKLPENLDNLSRKMRDPINDGDDLERVLYDISYISSVVKDETISPRNIVRLSSWVNLTEDFVKTLAGYITDGKKIVELMSGSGSLATALSKYGVNIVATSIERGLGYDEREWTNKIAYMDAISAIENITRDTRYVIMSYPSPKNDLDYECVKYIREITPWVNIIYIGDCMRGNKTFVSDKFKNEIYKAGLMQPIPELNKHLVHSMKRYDYCYLIKAQ